MKFLLETQIDAFLRPGKSIEQFIGNIEDIDYAGFRWIAVERKKDRYRLVVHEVFDDRERVQSIYDFSYIEPDNIYGKLVQEFDNVQDALTAAMTLFGARTDKYLPFDYLDVYLDKYVG
jgi:hypothetical protein